MNVCMTACSAFPLGTDADTAGNTVGCRAYHAGAASSAAATHCPHAGPTGGGMCGSNCEAYCNLTAKACTGANALSFSDYGTCFTICNNTYDMSGKNLPLDTTGATVQCKIYHATVAGNSTANAAIHCPHTSQSGDGHCGTNCENYCYTSTKTGCTGQNTFANTAECNSFCSGLPTGKFSDVAGNTVQCRVYHWGVASVSVTSGNTHCSHGTPSGGDHCGTFCEVYCQLAIQNCNGSNVLYSGSAAMTDCTTACAKFDATGKAGDTAGNTVQCRIYHLGVAGQSAALATTHCAHGLTASAVCQGGATPTPTPSSSSNGSASTFILSIFGLLVVLFF